MASANIQEKSSPPEGKWNDPEAYFLVIIYGKGDLAVMSIEAYEELTSRFELYSQIKEGMNDIASDNTRPFCKSDIPVKQKNQSSADYHTGCRKQ